MFQEEKILKDIAEIEKQYQGILNIVLVVPKIELFMLIDISAIFLCVYLSLKTLYQFLQHFFAINFQLSVLNTDKNQILKGIFLWLLWTHTEYLFIILF